jgi:beta-galactosidase
VVQEKRNIPDLQSSSYDLEACSWSNVPDEILYFKMTMGSGEFVWTGFDYWANLRLMMKVPSSSYFGINDLACLKTLLFIQAVGIRKNQPFIFCHIGTGKVVKGKQLLFLCTQVSTVLNFYKWQKHEFRKKKQNAQNRYRLMWMDVKYEPGTVK